MAESNLGDLLVNYLKGEKVVNILPFKSLLEAVIPERRYKVLVSVKDQVQATVLHRAAGRNDIEIVRPIMELLGKEERYKLLEMQDSCLNTAIIHASPRGVTDVLKCMLESIDSEKCYQLLSIPAYDGQRALQQIIQGLHPETATYLLDLLPPDKQIQLLNLLGRDKKTALDVAREKDHTATVECLLLYRSNAEAHLKQVQERQRETNANASDDDPSSEQFTREKDHLNEKNQQINILKRKIDDHERNEKNLHVKIEMLEEEVARLRQEATGSAVVNAEKNEANVTRQSAFNENVIARVEKVEQEAGQCLESDEQIREVINDLTEAVVNLRGDFGDQQEWCEELERKYQQVRAATLFQGQRLKDLSETVADHGRRLELGRL